MNLKNFKKWLKTIETEEITENTHLKPTITHVMINYSYMFVDVEYIIIDNEADPTVVVFENEDKTFLGTTLLENIESIQLN